MYPAFLYQFQASANLVDPVRWGHLPPTYTTQYTPASRKAALFAGNFDEGVLPIDYAHRDLDTLGGAVTLSWHSVLADNYKAPVFLGIGDRKYILHDLMHLFLPWLQPSKWCSFSFKREAKLKGQSLRWLVEGSLR